MRKISVFILSAATMCVWSLAPVAALAQTVVTSHYQPLFGSGLKSGVLTQRIGFVYQNGMMFYHTTDFRDNDVAIVKLGSMPPSKDQYLDAYNLEGFYGIVEYLSK